MPTLAEVTHDASQQLAKVSDSARLDAELLIAQYLDIPRARFISRPDTALDVTQCKDIEQLIQRRARGEPIAYILGYRHFWDLELKVSPAVLIPRPDTELLVETTLELFRQDQEIHLLDLGTGSGAIALAIAKARPHWQVHATDDSADALCIANENTARHQLSNLKLIHSHWFDALAADKTYQVIVSNPPYIRENDPHLQQGDVRFEPRQALISGEDGLDDIRHLIPTSKQFLAPDGWLILEHGYDQGELVRQLFIDYGYQSVRQMKDLGGHIRLTMGQL